MKVGFISAFLYIHSPTVGFLPAELYASWGSFHKAILATVDLNYLRLILQLPALIFKHKLSRFVEQAASRRKMLRSL